MTWIMPEVQERCWSYLGGIAKGEGAAPLAIGGIADHVHMLLELPYTVPLSEVIRRIKCSSSLAFKKFSPDLINFKWQDGFGLFSISPANLPVAINYISGQAKHHQTESFEQELKKFHVQ